MNLSFKLWALGNKLFTKKKNLGRIFNCILMICNLAKKKKGDVTFRLTFLNGTLFRYVYLHACTRPGHWTLYHSTCMIMNSHVGF